MKCPRITIVVPTTQTAGDAMTRTGKIAWLPRTIREQLNRRLEDGEPGSDLVAWLNALPPARMRTTGRRSANCAATWSPCARATTVRSG